jgi:hypothetical protein
MPIRWTPSAGVCLHVNYSQGLDGTHRGKRIVSWDSWATVFFLLLLMVPLPFARFESWPSGRIISEHLVTPWSRFQLCYTDYPGGQAVQETFNFTWKGELIPRGMVPPELFFINSLDPPAFQWQSTPEVVLKESFYKGELLRLETFWQPVLLWPFKMGWQAGPNA